MNTIILNVLCEGETEDRFVSSVLKDYLISEGIVVKHRLLLTSKKKNAAGGVTSYIRVKNDLDRWEREVAHKSNESHYFTTMLDFYGLPNDFPGYSESLSLQPYIRIEKMEDAFAKDINQSNFIPYIQMHEFEALLFSNISKLKDEYPKCSKEIDDLQKVMDCRYDGNP